VTAKVEATNTQGGAKDSALSGLLCGSVGTSPNMVICWNLLPKTDQMWVKGGRDRPVLVHQGLVCQEVDVLDVVVRLVLPLGLLVGLPGVDALHNAQFPAWHVLVQG